MKLQPFAVSMLLPPDEQGRMLAALNLGHFGVKLHRSSDAGATWDEIAVPAYPPKPEGFVDTDMWGREREWTTKNIWALTPALDADGLGLDALNLGRGVGDCGDQSDWGWTGERFALLRYREFESCAGVLVETWPVLW